MEEELALRFVEERKRSRKLSATVSPVGIRPQYVGTAVQVVALATLEAAPVPAELMAETR